MVSRSNRASVVGYYGMSNYGDDLFLEAIRGASGELMPGLRIRVVGGFAALEPRKRSLEGLKARLYASNSTAGAAYRLALGIYAVATSGTIVLGGGSVLWGVTGVREIQRRMSNMLTTRFMAFGVSIGPFASLSDRDNVTRFVRVFDRVVVRDASSLVLGRSMRPMAEVSLGGDLAALYNPPPETRVRDSATRRIGFSVCAYPGFGVDDAARAARALAAALKHTRKDGITDEVVVLALNNHRDSGDDTLATAAQMALSEQSINSSVARYADYGVAGTWHLISSLDALLAVRLHAAITAYLTSVPFALVEYHSKCTDFVDDIAQPLHLRLETTSSSDRLYDVLVDLFTAPTAPELSPQSYRARAARAYVKA